MSLKANGYVETARAPLSGIKGGEDAYRHVEGGGCWGGSSRSGDTVTNVASSFRSFGDAYY